MSITSIKVENLSKRYRIGSRKQINDTFLLGIKEADVEAWKELNSIPLSLEYIKMGSCPL